MRDDDIQVLRAIKKGLNTRYLLSKDEELSMLLSSIQQSIDRLLKYGFIEEEEQGARGKIPLTLTVNGERSIAKIPMSVTVNLNREKIEKKKAEQRKKRSLQNVVEYKKEGLNNPQPGSFCGLTGSMGDMSYRVETKNNKTRVISVFHGTLFPGYEIENADFGEIGTANRNII